MNFSVIAVVKFDMIQVCSLFDSSNRCIRMVVPMCRISYKSLQTISINRDI